VGAFRSAKNRKTLTDSEISGLIRVSQNANLKYVVTDHFYIIDDGVKKPMGNVSELLLFLRGRKRDE
jgi:hypothetical protein